MNELMNIIQVAVDAYHGNVTKYSQDNAMQLLREALVEANGGSTRLDYKKVRDGQCSKVFAIVEEILSRTIVEGLQNDDYFMSLVDYRNVALGDMIEWEIEDSDVFVVAEAADGTQGIRRQRLSGSSSVSFPTSFKVVKIYEELNRVLSGQVDFNKFIAKVAESFRRKILEDVYSLWSTVTAEQMGGVTYFPVAGAYDEDALIELIQHVEAAAGGKKATILGTKVALRNLAPSIQGNESKSDLYNLGYYGKFFGTDVVALPQRHKINSTEFLFDDKMIMIVAGDDKPIKFIYEGNPTLIVGNPLNNQDLTHEYLYGERYGIGLVLAGGNAGIGRYLMA